ncbi:MAG: hypothetical protein EXS63_02570 [Candidatus Omnitrophica bacterium]|nr:hypothetical protein [Candidatus Omnitrophota bacterium]
MITECPNCRTKIAKGVIKCPKCAELFFENALAEGPAAASDEPVYAPAAVSKSYTVPEPEESLSDRERVSSSPSSENENTASVSEAVGMIYSQLKSKILFWNILMIWSVILSVASIFMVTRSTMMMSDVIDKSIADRFSSVQVSKSLMEVAQKQAKGMIEKTLDPAIQDFTKKMGETALYIEKSRGRFDDKYALLAKKSALIDEKKTILKLSEQSLRGYRKAYDELALRSEREAPEELAQMAKTELLRIEKAFRLTTRMDGTSVNYADQTGKGLIDDAVPTDVLIRKMRESPSWKIRARAAQLLGNRVDSDLPDILLEAAEMDPYLDITKQALESFSKMTGYDGAEIFGIRQARSWWKESKPQFVSRTVTRTNSEKGLSPGDNGIQSSSLLQQDLRKDEVML